MGKRIPFPLVARDGDPIAVVHSFLGARACPAACPGDYGRLRPTARTGPGLWGSSSRFRWTLGSGHPAPVTLPTRPLEPPPSQNGSWVWSGSSSTSGKGVVSSCAQQSFEQFPDCAYLSWRYGFTKLASAGTKNDQQTDRLTETDRQTEHPARSGWTELTCVWGISLRVASSQCEVREMTAPCDVIDPISRCKVGPTAAAGWCSRRR